MHLVQGVDAVGDELHAILTTRACTMRRKESEEESEGGGKAKWWMWMGIYYGTNKAEG